MERMRETDRDGGRGADRTEISRLGAGKTCPNKCQGGSNNGLGCGDILGSPGFPQQPSSSALLSLCTPPKSREGGPARPSCNRSGQK